MEVLQYTCAQGVGVLTICRPGALNALNSQVIDRLIQTLDKLAENGPRCMILTGQGDKAFVAGADIAEMKDFTPAEARAFSLRGNALMEKLQAFPVPVIAAINGYALGGGCELALSCDFRFAADHAEFAFPEVSLGLIPGYGGIQRAARLIGLSRAKLLAFTGRRIGAQTALEWGLVDEVHRPDRLLGEARRLAVSIAAQAPKAVVDAKRVANACVGLTLQEAEGLEAELFSRCFGTAEQQEAMRAFVEGCRPKAPPGAVPPRLERREQAGE